MKKYLEGLTADAAGALALMDPRLSGRDTLEAVFTIDDPKTFSSPWTAKAVYRFVPQLRVAEYICENNRNGAETFGGATGFAPPAGR